jgi:hypothetical protein
MNCVLSSKHCCGTMYDCQKLRNEGGFNAYNLEIFFYFGITAPPPPSGPWPPHLRGFQITHKDTPQSVGLLWTSDQLVAETSTWQHTTLTTDRHPSLQWDSNHNIRRRAAADLRLRPRGYWDRLVKTLLIWYILNVVATEWFSRQGCDRTGNCGSNVKLLGHQNVLSAMFGIDLVLRCNLRFCSTRRMISRKNCRQAQPKSERDHSHA